MADIHAGANNTSTALGGNAGDVGDVGENDIEEQPKEATLPMEENFVANPPSSSAPTTNEGTTNPFDEFFGSLTTNFDKLFGKAK
mmetsp:Transcript_23467/g.34900  ORF Transcript_23467/g.34900 Transcript_23467/m.34900 type:complete len:85 (-) Transcript_23467:179-433(-)